MKSINYDDYAAFIDIDWADRKPGSVSEYCYRFQV